MKSYIPIHTRSDSQTTTLPPINTHEKIQILNEDVTDYIDNDIPKSYKKFNQNKFKNLITNKQDCFDKKQHPKYALNRILKNNREVGSIINDIKRINKNFKLSLEEYHQNIVFLI